MGARTTAIYVLTSPHGRANSGRPAMIRESQDPVAAPQTAAAPPSHAKASGWQTLLFIFAMFIGPALLLILVGWLRK